MVFFVVNDAIIDLIKIKAQDKHRDNMPNLKKRPLQQERLDVGTIFVHITQLHIAYYHSEEELNLYVISCYFYLQRDSKYDENVQSNTGPKETIIAEDKANTNAAKVSLFSWKSVFS